jgi:hypothetical protein
MMDLIPVLRIIRMTEQPLLLLLHGLLLAIFVVSMIPTLCSVDFLIVLPLLSW